MSKGFTAHYRVGLLAGIVLASFAAISVKLFWLHVVQREELTAVVERARRQVVLEPARRGNIIDARGDVLATSRSLLQLGFDPKSLDPKDEPKWEKLAQLLHMTRADIRKLRAAYPAPTAGAKPSVTDEEEPTPPLPAAAGAESTTASPASKPAGTARWVKLSDTVEESVYAEIQALEIKGVYGHREYRRAYPHDKLAAHLIGYVTKDGTPATGVERYADFYLRGLDGWRESEKDGKRRELAQFRSREVDATAGYTVRLSIDAVIQHIVEAEIDTVVKTLNPAKVAIIVSDPHSGFILALGNYPNYNLNAYNKLTAEQMGNMRNAAITDLFDPGSTFKIVPAAGALNDGLVQPDSRFNCMQETIEYKGRTRRFMRDDHKFDHPLSVAEIISHSSNVGACLLAMKLGEAGLYNYARAFGFGEKSGFPFGGEVSGLLHSPEKWSGSDITRIPAGYSISVTPLQIHYAMATIASGGMLMRPQIIREVLDEQGSSVYSFSGSVRRQVISTKTAQQVAHMLEGVVGKEGTAPKAAIPGFGVAGKTGTAQKLINGRYSDRNHVGSFVGFFPANRPRVVISVIVDDATVPGGLRAYGSTVAAPSFKRIGEQLIQYLEIQPLASPVPNLLALQGAPR